MCFEVCAMLNSVEINTLTLSKCKEVYLIKFDCILESDNY